MYVCMYVCMYVSSKTLCTYFLALVIDFQKETKTNISW